MVTNYCTIILYLLLHVSANHFSHLHGVIFIDMSILEYIIEWYCVHLLFRAVVSVQYQLRLNVKIMYVIKILYITM
jgi:hypothetical protein